MSMSVMEATQYAERRAVITETQDRLSYIIIKRLMDLALTIMGFIILLPIFVLVTFLIKFEDPWSPVFYSQIRVGKNGKTFRMYKFRSMVTNAEDLLEKLLEENEVSGAMFKMKNDPRITPIGRFIRKTSIDELPQLWNVLKGDMSLVGPRPPLQREVISYTNYELQRLLVTPGCTGLWQVSGRNSVGFEEMVMLDLNYIRERSVIYDVKIILKTVFVFFGSKNAF